MNNCQPKMRVKYFKDHSRSKSHITFAELEKKANQVFEFGNEWGLYVDIEKCEFKYDHNFQKFKYVISHSPIKEEFDKEFEIENKINIKNIESPEKPRNNSIITYLAIFKNKSLVKKILFGYGVLIIIGSTFILNYMFIKKY